MRRIKKFLKGIKIMLDISAWIILLWILWLYLHGWHIDLIQLTPPEQIGQEVIYDGSGLHKRTKTWYH